MTNSVFIMNHKGEQQNSFTYYIITIKSYIMLLDRTLIILN